MFDKAQRLLRKARALRERGKLEPAWRAARGACDRAPAQTEAWVTRGELAAQLNYRAEAAEAFCRAAELEQARDAAAARLLAERALRTEPGCARAARLLQALGPGRPAHGTGPAAAAGSSPAIGELPLTGRLPQALPVAAAAPAGQPVPGAAEGPAPARTSEEVEVWQIVEARTAAVARSKTPTRPPPTPPGQRGAPDGADPGAAGPLAGDPCAAEPDAVPVGHAGAPLPCDPHAGSRADATGEGAGAEAAAAVRRRKQPSTPPPVPQGTPSGRRRLRRTTGRIVWDDLVLAEFSPPAAAESATGAEFPLGEVATGDVVKAITASVSSSPLLSELDGELVTYLIDCGTLSFRRAGTVIFAEGEAGASLFLILRGRCRVERRGPAGTSLELATLRPGAFFGELAVLTDAPRSTTVRAVDDVTLLEVSRAVLRELIGREPAVLRLLLRFFRARMVGALLATSPLFTSLQAAAHRDWVSRFRLSEVPAREYVLRRGAAGRGLHVVLAGELSVRAPEPGADDTLLAVLGPGEVFGEMSLLGDGLATADVRTELRSWLLWLPRDDFFELIAHRPGVREALEMLAERRRAANRELLPPVEPV